MMNLIHHHRIHIPNGLAVLAAFLLLGASVTGIQSDQEGYSSAQEITAPTKVEANDADNINDAVENKRRGLKLGSLLFRR